MAFQCIDSPDTLAINLNVFKLLQVELKLVDYFLTLRFLWRGLKLKLKLAQGCDVSFNFLSPILCKPLLVELVEIPIELAMCFNLAKTSCSTPWPWCTPCQKHERPKQHVSMHQ